MQYLGVQYEMKHAPKLDPGFIPLSPSVSGVKLI